MRLSDSNPVGPSLHNTYTHLLLLLRLLHPHDQLLDVVEDLLDPTLVVPLLQGLVAHLSDDADAAANLGSLQESH